MLYSILKSDALSKRFVHWDVFRGVETPGLNPLSLRDNDRPPKDHVPSGPARISHAPVRNARRAPKAFGVRPDQPLPGRLAAGDLLANCKICQKVS